MTQRQTWQTIGLDLKRTGQYLCWERPQRARYYFDEVKSLLTKNNLPAKISRPLKLIDWTRENLDKSMAEDFLTAGTIVSLRANVL